MGYAFLKTEEVQQNDVHMTRHLDIGCGDNPRNPFAATELYGADLVDFEASVSSAIKLIKADLFKSFPFEDNFFESISAYDFLEHVPRAGGPATTGGIELPFIGLMNEVWRVLKHGGVLIASTPAYPHKKAFQDPTHVNIITEDTHGYFVGREPYAQRYGFIGRFEVVFVGWDAEKNAKTPLQSKFKKAWRNAEHMIFKGGRSHLTWILRAIKI